MLIINQILNLFMTYPFRLLGTFRPVLSNAITISFPNFSLPFKQFSGSLGPGVITGAADVDPAKLSI